MLDRDGVINVDRSESVLRVDDFQLIPQAAQAISLLNQAQIPVAIVTNQACVGRGTLSWEGLTSIHEKMKMLLAADHAHIDEIYICTDVSIEPNKRRKPAPGMLKEALERFKARPEKSPFIGDALRDLQAAAAIGCPAILVRTGRGHETENTIQKEISENEHNIDVKAVKIFDNLYTAVESLLKMFNPSYRFFNTSKQY